jgi:2-oxoglutarate dehydrogenase E2 component (dihydrolipoamide succinyltransferase)
MTSHPYYQIDVAVNAPEAGTIKEFLVNEEDTVTVGQDLLKLELGGVPKGNGDKMEAKEQPKEPASTKQHTSSDSQPPQTKEQRPTQETSPPPPPPPSPPKENIEPTKTEAPVDPKKSDSKLDTSLGNREERRV